MPWWLASSLASLFCISMYVPAIDLLTLQTEDRRMVSLYAMARVAQCVYNILKARGLWHFWGSDWNHGDALLFALTSAQIMYAYVMRPTSLPASYYKFIQRYAQKIIWQFNFMFSVSLLN
jgi:hypothetical protein